jgi:hypothetical protein
MYLLLAGVVVDGIILPLGARVMFPPFLSNWDELGPIGVALALLRGAGPLARVGS